MSERLCECGCGTPVRRRLVRGHNTRLRSLPERFWEKVRKGPDCWEWLATVDSCGYGRLSAEGRLQGAHRVSYMLHFGSIPDGLEVCHRCDNPACTNPEHLFLATHGENMNDMWRKERNPIVRLSRTQELEVKDLVAQGWDKQWIADAYGVSFSTIDYLKKRKFPGPERAAA